MDRAASSPLTGKMLGLVGSAAVHAAVIAAALVLSARSPAPRPELLYTIDLEPDPLGALQGTLDGTNPDLKAAPAVAPAPPAAAERGDSGEPRAARPTATAAAAPTGAPVVTATAGTFTAPAASASAAAAPEKSDKSQQDAEREAMREAVRRAMLAPSSEGASAAPPLGDPRGEAGAAPKAPKPRVSARYAGVLDGWFSSRVSLRGLDLPWDELKNLRATVTISISPDRHVTSFSMGGGSGNGAYDARVQSSLQAIVASGATLPAPAEDEEVPASMTLVFRCRTQERCS